eukprot:CCRYP_014775-RA/>CCRYP_014775-RA protein AED:0.47 eAED:0.47 QI:0/-1/0/1/-1/1/1/0/62
MDKDAVTGLDKKIKVTSPNAEEVEMLFADKGFIMSGSGAMRSFNSHKESNNHNNERNQWNRV